MSPIEPLLQVIDAYVAATGLADKTVSSRVFKDQKKIAALREGKDITVTRYQVSLQWLSDHWPDNAVWPSGVRRPAPKANDAHTGRAA